jgi:hypothetical protein
MLTYPAARAGRSAIVLREINKLGVNKLQGSLPAVPAMWSASCWILSAMKNQIVFRLREVKGMRCNAVDAVDADVGVRSKKQSSKVSGNKNRPT